MEKVHLNDFPENKINKEINCSNYCNKIEYIYKLRICLLFLKVK